MSINIELDVDHGITFLTCLLGHDPQHDLYYGHGTGAPRAKATYNNEMAGQSPTGPGQGLFQGGMKGGLKDANQDIITIQSELDKINDIKFMLKYAAGAIRNYADNIFINIKGRSKTNRCATLGDLIIYLDTSFNPLTAEILEPGRIVINKEVISPLQIKKINVERPNTSEIANSYTINEGIYQGYSLLYLDQGGPGGNQRIIQVFNPFGQPVAQLNNVYGECVEAEILEEIVAMANKAMQDYEALNYGRSGEDTPANNLTFDAYVTQLGMNWPGNTLFYKIATSGLLSVIIENKSGPSLLYELFTNPKAMNEKMPPEKFEEYNINMNLFLENYFSSVKEFNSMAASDKTIDYETLDKAVGTLQFVNTIGWDELNAIISGYEPWGEENLTQILLASATVYLNDKLLPQQKISTRNVLEQAAKYIKRFGFAGNSGLADLLSLTIALDDLASTAILEEFEAEEETFLEADEGEEEAKPRFKRRRQFEVEDTLSFAETPIHQGMIQRPLGEGSSLINDSMKRDKRAELTSKRKRQGEGIFLRSDSMDSIDSIDSIDSMELVDESTIRPVTNMMDPRAADAGQGGSKSAQPALSPAISTSPSSMTMTATGGAAPHSNVIVPIYSVEVGESIFNTISLVRNTHHDRERTARAESIQRELTFKDRGSIMYDLFIAPGRPFQSIAKDMSVEIGKGKILGNPPEYISSKIQQNKIPDRRCLSRPDVETTQTFLVLLDNLSEAYEYLENPANQVERASAEQQVQSTITDIYNKIINSTTNPTIEMPIKTCSTLKGQAKTNYRNLMSLFYRVRSMIYLFSIIIREAISTSPPDLSNIVPAGEVINWISTTRSYVDELLSVFKMIANMTGSQTELDDIAITNNAFVVGSCSQIALAIYESLLPYASPISKNVSYAVEKQMLENQIKKILDGKRGGAPDDTKLVKSIYTTSNFYNYFGTVVSKWPAAEIKGTKLTMFQDMVGPSPGLGIDPGDTLKTMMSVGRDEGKFFVNNAVSLGEQQLGANVYKNNFCPISSIVDAQTTVCNSLKIARSDGYEYGIQDVSVFSVNPENGNRVFTYRVRVVPDMSKNPPIKISIAAYLQVLDDVYINMAADNAIVETSWPGDNRSPRSNDLNNINLDDAESPLAARKCLFDLQKVFDDPTTVVGGMNSYTDIINVIDGSEANVDRMALIRQILEVSFRKSLGDYLQELSTVAQNGGYVDGYGIFPATAKILRPDVARLGLHNDRPAFARAMLLSLYGKTGINPSSLSALTVTDKLDRLNYIAVGRNISTTAISGGRKTMKKGVRTRRKINKKKKTRKAKPNCENTRKAKKPKKKTRIKRDKIKNTK